ncbi:MAG TPA: energy-coupling factor ABC transporter permease [Candidatus Thiothrix moscowensis]|uniref:energy-coupling factor ABC transporter permease n=1 Tax=unclassified Thiothrix TaxID=2636184 RepID=UPI0025D19739|nr:MULTISPECIES: energy-coupling factor ABC transporter permease [unclassified Thiothrix]HRJ51598.1 energy-coupling factor ABC transporter permease [Candidatus Thiothrix moscowensis]HRJ91913.1 energy-coupling factor ABC transporter permease [Candidatus Thiothrix moscowensis]
MHIPDSMLQGAVCSVTAAVSVAGVLAAAWLVMKAEHKPSAGRFAAVVALIFAGQMMNFPIMNGTSGHLLGGVLAAAVLGTPLGVLAIALVVTIQSLVFSDGGVTVLGANVLNMALIGAGVGGWLQQRLAGSLGQYVSTAVAAWCSVVLASAAVSLELAIDGQAALGTVLPAMVGTHALIGLGEAAISVAAVALLLNWAEAQGKAHVAVPLLAAVLVALLLSPFASGFPDGLEWVAGQYQFLHESAPAFVGAMPDYTVAAISNESLSTGVAGLAGVLICFVLGFGLLRGMERLATQR